MNANLRLKLSGLSTEALIDERTANAMERRDWRERGMFDADQHPRVAELLDEWDVILEILAERERNGDL